MNEFWSLYKNYFTHLKLDWLFLKGSPMSLLSIVLVCVHIAIINIFINNLVHKELSNVGVKQSLGDHLGIAAQPGT